MAQSMVVQETREQKLMRTNICVFVRHPDSLTWEERNRRSLQIYNWLNERVGRDAWCLRFAENNAGSRQVYYFIPYEVAMYFKLAWGGGV